MRSYAQSDSSQSMQLSPVLEIRRAPDPSSPEIVGYASAFGGPPDCYGTIFQKGCFTRTLKEAAAEGVSVPMLWAHHFDEPIGRWTALEEDGRGLLVRGVINTKTARGRETLDLIEAGDVTGLSVGITYGKGGFSFDKTGIRTFTDVDLLEISATPIPANKRARIQKAPRFGSKRDLVEHLQASGIAKAAAIRIAGGGWSALARTDQASAESLIDRINMATAKLRSSK